MNGPQFDGLLRAAAESRRTVLGSALAATATWLGWSDSEAKKRKKRKQKCKGDRKKCGKRCIPAANCCDDDACAGGAICQDGSCELCIGVSCLNDDECCWGYCDNPGVRVCVCNTGGANCTTSRECCSRSCDNIVGGVGKCACDPPGTVCFDDGPCCSGSCDIPSGQMSGACS